MKVDASGGFISPKGERGIDNAFYRAWGCIMSYRGTPYHAYLSQRANDKMLDGLYTMVVRLSGNRGALQGHQRGEKQHGPVQVHTAHSAERHAPNWNADTSAPIT